MAFQDFGKKYTAYNARPFVGYVASDTTVEVVREGDQLICRPTLSSFLVLGLIIALVVVSSVFAIQSPEARRLQMFWHYPFGEKIAIGLMGLFILLLLGVALVFIVQKLFFFGKLMVDSNGVIRLCQGWLAQEVRVIRPGEIQDLQIAQVHFNGKYKTYTNHILIVQLESGTEIVLCAATEQALILQLRQEIANWTGFSLPEAS